MKKILLSIICFSVFYTVKAQTPITSPDGEPIISSTIASPAGAIQDKIIVATAKSICVYDANTSGQPIAPPIVCYHPTGDRKIVDMKGKFLNYKNAGGWSQIPNQVLILFSDGSIIELGFDNGEPEFDLYSYGTGFGASEMQKKVLGDDVYVLTNNNCYVTRDSGKTFQIDTLGLGGGFMNSGDLDSNQRVYLGSSKGLFQQELISNQWNKNTNYKGTQCSYVFVDWMQRIWASNNSTLYMSNNFGNSFINAPTGLSGTIKSIATDHWGNVFVVTGDKVFRSVGGTTVFIQVGAGIASQIDEALNSNALGSVCADSIIYVGTIYGLFYSNDQGANWGFLALEAESNAGLVKSSSGRLVVSNVNGIHTKEAGNSQWIKKFPLSGLGRAEKIFKTSNGILYTTTQSRKLIWKSADNGDTWTIDTAGYPSASTVNSFYVDPAGNMHVELITSTPILYVRNSGGSWLPDTTGLVKGVSTITFGTDNLGYLYVSNSSGLQKRPISGGKWVMDTVGLWSAVFDLAMDANGNMWAGCYDGLFKRTAGVWQRLFNPPGTNPNFTNACFVISIDVAGALWAQYSIFNTKFQAIGTGVYFTLDGGTNWKSMSIDTITFKQLISVGDTTYGISYFDGLWQFTRDGVGKVIEQEKENSFVTLYPNPATNELTITLQQVVLNGKMIISDLNGKKVYEGSLNSTKHMTLDISKLASGLYTLEVSSERIHEVKKFVKD